MKKKMGALEQGSLAESGHLEVFPADSVSHSMLLLKNMTFMLL